MKLRWPSDWNATRALLAACALAYFYIGKIAFEPRLAFGVVSLNQILQIGILVGLAAMLWCADPGRMVRSRALWLAAALALLLAVRAIGAGNLAYSPVKPLGYLGLVIPCLALIAASLRGATDTRRFLYFWALAGTGMMLLGVALLVSGHSPPRLGVFGGGSNGYARMVGTALLLWIGLDARFGARRGRIWLLALPGFALALLFAGSKTAIVGLGVALTVLGLLNGNRKLVLGALAGTFLFVAAPMWAHTIVQRADKNRGEVRMFTAPDTDDPRGSYGTRILFYRRSLQFLPKAGWLGAGTGEWHSVVGLPSGRRHPHNMELELGCELGLVGLAWLAVLLGVVGLWVRGLRGSQADRRLVGALVAVFVFWLFNAQFNGDLLDNRWILLAALLLEIVLSEQRAGAIRLRRAMPQASPLHPEVAR